MQSAAKAKYEQCADAAAVLNATGVAELWWVEEKAEVSIYPCSKYPQNYPCRVISLLDFWTDRILSNINRPKTCVEKAEVSIYPCPKCPQKYPCDFAFGFLDRPNFAKHKPLGAFRRRLKTWVEKAEVSIYPCPKCPKKYLALESPTSRGDIWTSYEADRTHY
jgi:hypothetical protein